MKNGMKIGFALLVSTTAAAGQSTTIFRDTTFKISDYSILNLHTPPTFANSFQSTAGNPGTSFGTTFQAQPNITKSAITLALNNNFVYDPAVSGPVSHLNFEFDRYFTNTFKFTPGVGPKPPGIDDFAVWIYIQQGANYYVYKPPEVDDPGNTWISFGIGGLTANDFGLFQPMDLEAGLDAVDFTKHFNPDSGPIKFGFALRNGVGTFSDVFIANMLVDNFGVAVAVPEPASWSMMIAGFGLAGVGMRHRRRRVSAMVALP